MLQGAAKKMGKSADQLSLRFLFANYDGVYVILDFDMDTPQEEVKYALLENWPDDVEKPSDVRRMRLLCMGKELENSSTKTLRHAKIPAYSTHPTPVNVSVLPKHMATPAQDDADTETGAKAQGCCVVM
ncbi:Hypothetical Protein FCC1311_112302 [Hondaea fermentalgiana]|uniref:UBL3-like ubiquitin domain-containing protein n=1 Tax=Hondaea fermentalgiana TaxID=2315210 RepID=A0A2R5GYW2_9STRA|nr:Hypothetical Protein FCC1311_112302 [Hondaea fermentalgiana]|eukprot:GBG35008.1 Hypothetical Protein FCC1311_112302 [Hondaea fermentalgiana]